MLIDTHCHIDLYQNPKELLKKCDREGITVLAMTNLPSHFEMGYSHVVPYKKIRLALGMHPLYAKEHEKEFSLFLKNLPKTSYIGEVGLDFSREGIHTKEIQVHYFKKILSEVQGKKKLLSLHSRKAEKEVLNFLLQYRINSAIFHWYSGAIGLIDQIVQNGYYFSVNPAMIKSEKGRAIIKRIPIRSLLTETDGPFIEYNARQVTPHDVSLVEEYLSISWQKSRIEVSEIINSNFQTLIKSLA